MDDLLHNPDCEKYRDRYTLRKKENELLCRRGFSHNCAAVFIFTKSAAGEAKTPCREVFRQDKYPVRKREAGRNHVIEV